MKKIPVVSFLILTFTIWICLPVFAHSVKIVGPDHITVKVGQPVKVTYITYVDGKNMTNTYPSEADPMLDPHVVSLSKNIEVYRDAEDDIHGDTPTKEPYYVAGLKPGTGYFTIQTGVNYHGGPAISTKKKVTVTIKKGNALCLNGELIGYNTRSNKFTVKIRNYSSKSVKILSRGAKAINYDYKTFDRSLRISGKSSITIKPGKTKKIVFKASGRSTWYDFDDFYIKCKCKLGKKTYTIKIYAGDFDSEWYIPGYVATKKKGKWTSLMLCAPELVRENAEF